MLSVGIIEDSPTIQRLISKILGSQDGIEIAWAALNTVEARRLIRERRPSVLTLDINLPGENGLDFLQNYDEGPLPPVLTVSSLSEKGSIIAIEALKRGAVDTIAKPKSKDDVMRFGRELISKVQTCGMIKSGQKKGREFKRREYVRKGKGIKVEVIGVVSSTGGWKSLTSLLTGLIETAPPVLVAQHIEPAFAPKFCARLNDEHSFDVAIAKEGETLKRSMVRFAPPGFHITARRSGIKNVIKLIPSESDDVIVPNGDKLLSRLAKEFGSNALGVVLSGMGTDGASGLLDIKNASGKCFGESEASCTIYGMSRVAREKNKDLIELSAVEIGNKITDMLGFERVGGDYKSRSVWAGP